MSEPVRLYWFIDNDSGGYGFSRLINNGLEDSWEPQTGAGVSDSNTKNQEQYCEYTVNASPEQGPVPEMVAKIRDAERASVSLQCGSLEFILKKNPLNDRLGWIEHIELSAFRAQFHRYDRPKARQQAAADRVESLLSTARIITQSVAPIYGCGGDGAWIDNRFPSKQEIQRRVVPYINWFNCFGPEYLNTLDLDFVMSAPCWERELIDGRAVIIASDNPVHPSEEYKSNIDELFSYFGVER